MRFDFTCLDMGIHKSLGTGGPKHNERSTYSIKFGVLCGDIYLENCKTDFMRENVNSEVYGASWFCGATCHRSGDSMVFTTRVFEDGNISNDLWPPKSPDLGVFVCVCV